ncbi:MAG: hypothetical protein Q8L54_04175 [Devosia sp.]|nr:hypothetical protein [Devosia sp.]
MSTWPASVPIGRPCRIDLPCAPFDGRDRRKLVFLYPLAVSLIVTGVAWRWMFNPTLGIQNFLHSVGLTSGGLGTQPMSVALANVVITTTGEASYNENMAAALPTAIPPLFIYFVLGKFFVQGITAGAIEG